MGFLPWSAAPGWPGGSGDIAEHYCVRGAEAYPPEILSRLNDETGISAPTPSPMLSMPGHIEKEIDHHDSEANHGQYNQSADKPDRATT